MVLAACGRIAADGTPQPAFAITDTQVGGAAAVWDGTSYLVVWPQAAALFLAPVTVSGSVGSPLQITTPTGSAVDTAPALASDRAGTSLVAFERDDVTPQVLSVFVSRD